MSLHHSALFEKMTGYITTLQDRISAAIEERDSTSFRHDRWERPGGGGGESRVIQNGTLLEKGGVNVSSVHGELSEEAVSALSVDSRQFAACGISLVLHPVSPRIPSIHMNLRYFELESGDAWFGGGTDLTPFYPHFEDFRHFHLTLQNACEAAQPGSYRSYKEECDRYFYLPHRGEMRGVGGIFFDYLRENPQRTFSLVCSVGDSFLPSYLPIVDLRRDEPYEDADRDFQLFRRGRYAEFNLLYDRGTRFGLRTSGRVESILMSLPPLLSYPYDYKPPAGSAAERMQECYQPQEWAPME